MKIDRGTENYESLAGYVGYLLRAEETGIIVTSEIMQDATFQQQITDLLDAQRTAFYGRKIRMSEELQDRREEILDNIKKPFHAIGSSEVQKIAKIFHQLDASAKFQRQGKHFKAMIEPLPLPDVDDPEAVQKVIRAVEAIRDCFPKDLPALFTLHIKGESKKLSIEDAIRLRKPIHAQCILATKHWTGLTEGSKAWDSGWGKVCEDVAPKKGNEHKLSEMSDRVRLVASEIIGNSFKQRTVVKEVDGKKVRQAIDPDRPKRTLYTKEGARFIGRHTSDQLLRMPLESIFSPVIREEVRQVVAQAKYDRLKIAQANAEKRKPSWLKAAEMYIPSREISSRSDMVDVMRATLTEIPYLAAILHRNETITQQEAARKAKIAQIGAARRRSALATLESFEDSAAHRQRVATTKEAKLVAQIEKKEESLMQNAEHMSLDDFLDQKEAIRQKESELRSVTTKKAKSL